VKNLIFNKDLVVFYPATKAEYHSRQLQESIKHILSKKPSENFAFDLVIFFDQMPSDNGKDLLQYKASEFINEINIYDLNLSDLDNQYIQPWSNPESSFENAAPHGLSSGPNNSFYQSLYHLLDQKKCPHKYKYFFLFEADISIVKDYWYDFSLDFCNSNSFLIAGSKYKGIHKWHRVLEYKDHLNGIAIYKNCDELLYLLQKSEQHLLNRIKNGEQFLNFDIAIDEWRRSEQGRSFFNSCEPLIDTGFITNASDTDDQILSENRILDFYPETVFLHHKISSTKWNQNVQQIQKELFSSANKIFSSNYFDNRITPDKISIPLFFHIPKNAGTYIDSIIRIFFRKYTLMLRTLKKDPLMLRQRWSVFDDSGNHFFSFFLSFSQKNHLIDNLIKSDKLIPIGPKMADDQTYDWKIKFDDLSTSLVNSVDIFCCSVSSHGFRKFSILSEIFNKKFYNFHPFAVLRDDPLDHAISHFNYVHDDMSSHEDSYKSIKETAFKDYISSIQIEDSWLIRNILDVPDQESLTDELFSEFCFIFDRFQIFDSRDDLLVELKKFFTLFYNIDFNDLPSDWMDNVSHNKNLNKFSKKSLTDSEVETFKSKTHFNFKIVGKYLNG